MNQEHLGLAYLAAALREKGYSVKIIDSLLEKLSPEDGVQWLLQIDFAILGVSFLSYAWNETKELIWRIKWAKPEIQIILGGHFVSFTYKHILKQLPEVDYIMLGECEYSLPLLISKLKAGDPVEEVPGILSKDAQNIKVNPIINLDQLPFPARDYLPKVLKAGGITTMNTSRGCYGTCIFCSVHKFYRQFSVKKWRSRSAANVVQEIEFLIKDYGVNYFDFQDDNFIGPGKNGKERAKNIARLIGKKGIKANYRFDLRITDLNQEVLALWKEIGLQEVLVGIESIVSFDLKFYKKKITPEEIKAGLQMLDNLEIRYVLGSIFFHPYTKVKFVYENLRFLKEINYIDNHPLQILNVYEGTEARKIIAYKGDLSGEFYNYHWNFKEPNTAQYFQIAYKVYRKSIFLENLLIKNRCIKEVNQLKYLSQQFLLELAERFITHKEYSDLIVQINCNIEELYQKSKLHGGNEK